MKYPTNPSRELRARYEEHKIECLVNNLRKRSPEYREHFLKNYKAHNGTAAARKLRERINEKR